MVKIGEARAGWTETATERKYDLRVKAGVSSGALADEDIVIEAVEVLEGMAE